MQASLDVLARGSNKLHEAVGVPAAERSDGERRELTPRLASTFSCRCTQIGDIDCDVLPCCRHGEFKFSLVAGARLLSLF